jgi:hypothetical protein
LVQGQTGESCAACLELLPQLRLFCINGMAGLLSLRAAAVGQILSQLTLRSLRHGLAGSRASLSLLPSSIEALHLHAQH